MSKYSLTPYDMTHWEGLYGQIIGNGHYARVENGLAQEWVPGYGWYWCLLVEEDISDSINFIPKSKEFVESKIAEIEKDFSNKLKGQRELAIKIATQCHKGQKDKGGVDYINHPLKVSELCTHEIGKCVAILHDVMEDTGETYDSLENKGVLHEIYSRVSILTRWKDESYSDYIERISLDAVAREVKMADLTHNMDISRIPNPTEADFKRLEKYQKALNFLKNVNY